jgi:hypothetical protein
MLIDARLKNTVQFSFDLLYTSSGEISLAVSRTLVGGIASSTSSFAVKRSSCVCRTFCADVNRVTSCLDCKEGLYQNQHKELARSQRGHIQTFSPQAHPCTTVCEI